MLCKLVSGGQTGVDRAVLDFGLSWIITVEGWVPKGRVAEDGTIASRYPHLRETTSEEYEERTTLNVRDSDGTLMLSHGPLSGGSLLAQQIALQIGRPILHIDLTQKTTAAAVRTIVDWLEKNSIEVLNIGGPRSSEDPSIYAATMIILGGVLAVTENRVSTEDTALALGIFQDASANFRHWDQIRWLIPTWFGTLAAAAIALYSSEQSTSILESKTSLGLGIFGLICILLECNLIRYHQRTMASLKEVLGTLSIRSKTKDYFQESLPFKFIWPDMFKTATFWLIVGMVLITLFLFYNSFAHGSA